MVVGIILIATVLSPVAISLSKDANRVTETLKNTSIEGSFSESSDQSSFEEPDLHRLRYSFSFKEPRLSPIELHDRLFTKIDMPGTFSIGFEVGTPVIQVKPVKILLPQRHEVTDIVITTEEPVGVNAFAKGVNLVDTPIVPYQGLVPFGEQPPESLIIDSDVYESENLFPGAVYESVGVGYCRGYAILTLNLFPIQYRPATGELLYYPVMSVQVELEETGYVNRFYRDSFEDEAWVRSLVVNPEITDTYNEPSVTLYEGGLCDPSDNEGLGYDYVIITTAGLFDITGTTYNWDDLISRKEADGLEATKVKVEDIVACEDYWNPNPLFNDTPALIREFCRDAYEDWGTLYILIGGDDEGPNMVERREMDNAYESNVETDIYWTHLDKTFNDDEDDDWGEEGDTGFDLYSEMYSGSIPCDDGTDISNWLTKTFYYDDASDKDYLENAAFYGGDTGWSCEGDDFIDYSAIKGTDNWLGPDPEASGPYPDWLGFQYGFETWNLNNPGCEYNLSVKWTAEPPNEGWEGGSTSVATSGLRDDINADKCTLISGVAHANAYYSLDVHANTWEADYHNTKPFFLTDYGCHCGDMDAADDGVLHSMLFHDDTELAFATVYNTGYGWGNFYCTNSSSALMQKSFWDYLFDVTNNSEATSNWQMGKAQEWARDLMAPTINWSYSWRETIQCCLLFGDPAQVIKPPSAAILSYEPTSHDFGDVDQGDTASTTFDIWNSGEDTLTYTLSDPCDWVEVFPTSGESTGERDTITVYIDTTDLIFGPHQCDITINSNGGTGVFTVYVNVVALTEKKDQEQTEDGYNFAAYGSRWGAQSFKPLLEYLTKVELYLHKKGSPPNDAVVAIRDSLTGSDLTVVSKPASEISTEVDWVEFNFDDIEVTPGNTYYIILRTTGGNKLNCYIWKFGYVTPYEDGMLYFSSNAGSSWVEYIQYDFCFRTYGQSVPPNVAPIAEDDFYTTSEDTQLNVDAPGVLENDHDPDGGPNPLTAVLVNDVTHGTLTLNSDGSFTYDPDPDYYGTDSFTYKAYDGQYYSSAAIVTIDVTGVNDPPTAVDDSYTTTENTQLNVAAPGVLENDEDIDGPSALTSVLVDDVTHGTLTLNSDGSFTYDPDPDYIGSDSFTYQAYDGEDYSNIATVSISILEANDPPIAEDDSYATSEDTQLNIDAPGVLENDHDPDGGPNPLTAVLVDDVTHGTLTLNSDGSFTYDPDPDYYGTDSFTYQAYDGEDYSNLATVTIDVASVNDPPVAVDDVAETVVDTPVDIPVTDNDYDIDGTIDTSTVTIQTDASHGSTSVDPVTGVVTYTPDPGYIGSDSFTYTVDDDEGAVSNIATVDITVLSGDEVDQEQTQDNYNFIVYDDRWGAQSFKPTLGTLTRIELYMQRRGNPPNNVVVSIRESLTGEDLVVIYKSPSEIPSTVDWVEFDFEDISVTPGNTYYIVLRTTGGNSLNSYIWKFGYNTPYTDGEMWYSSNAGSSWTRYPQYDFCFRTYGR
jgi:VCBS repeat-containing protein